MKYGYWTEELPYCFLSKTYSTQIGTALREADALLTTTFFGAATYSIPGRGGKRRMLEFPHPLPYALLCKVIGDNWSEITTHFQCSSVSFSQTTAQGIKDSATWKLDFKRFREHCLIISSTRLWELKVDIESYYSSVYTHSISWALHGKENIKASLPHVDEKLLGNKLDSALRHCQRLETKGIATGPEASRIIAELICTAIDKEFSENLEGVGIELVGGRYVDDGHFFFHTRKEAEQALREFEAIVGKYHLHLNSEKTKIIERPCPFDSKWVLLITSFDFGSKEAATSCEHIKTYANLLITLALENPRDSVIKKGFGRFFEVQLNKENTDIFEALLYRVTLCDTRAIKQLILLIDNFTRVGHNFDRKRLSEFLYALLLRGVEHKHHFEVNWALFTLSQYKMEIEASVIQPILNCCTDPFAIVQILDMNEQKLIKGSLDLGTLNSRITNSGLNGSLWLVAYEAERSNWMPLGNISSHSFFKKLLDCGVHFYELISSRKPITPKEPIKKDVLEDY